MSNAFEAIKEIYDKGVEDHDKEGYAEYYKKSFECFKENLAKIGSEMKDYDYLDGYFIFGTGTNSVVHFHMKDCKDWIWGVWFSGKVTEEGTEITGEFFGQYEPEMDKFKPSRSSYVSSMRFVFDKDGCLEYFDEYAINKYKKIFTFIKKKPLRAWAHEWYGYDYNIDIVSDILLLGKYIAYKAKKKKNAFVEGRLEKSWLKAATQLIKTELEAYEDWKLEIQDNGEYTSPRYEVLVEIPDEDEQETGCYGIFCKDSEGKKQWEKLEQRYKRVANIFHTWWYPGETLDSHMILWKQREWEDECRIINESEEEAR